MSNLAQKLDRMTVPAVDLVEKLDDGAVRCLACAHRCLIKKGRRGICQVRYNEDGVLKAPWGYVAALNADPVEKKPFFHVLPGQDVLTFGMLGCDFHCGYCFTGDTIFLSDRGPLSLQKAFESSGSIHHHPDGNSVYPTGLQAVTSTGSLHRVLAVFRHLYRGPVVKLSPYYLPPITCTADHRVYATDDPSKAPQPIPAHQLNERYFLAIPYLQPAATPQVISVAELLGQHTTTYQTPWKLTEAQLEMILSYSAQGKSSRAIGLALGKDPGYIRSVRGKAARGLIYTDRTGGLLVEDHSVRFPKEHRPGIPLEIPLNEGMARLLGYYCAEGSVVQSKARPNSLVLNFSFAPEETHQASETQALVEQYLGVKARLVTRETTLGVTVTKASAGLLFKYLAGSGAQEKRVPDAVFAAPLNVQQAFLDAYIDGDGHRYSNGKTSVTTVSRALAYGVGMLALASGHIPSIYDSSRPEEGFIQGRKMRIKPHQYTVVWYTKPIPRRKVIRTDSCFLIPIRHMDISEYDGEVYNLEVEEDHTYLANFFLVSNCQNWFTSQTLRDEASDEAADYARRVTPEQLVAYARQTGSTMIASSYNEPLITSEWAVGVFKQAREAELKCLFVSNGNATPEALAYLRPYLSAYKVDLKTMQDKQYRKLGGVLQHVLDTISKAHELGLWVEVVTLLVPGFNDSPEELWEAARFITSVSPDIPWHVTAFHPDYKMLDRGATPVDALSQAAEIGQEAGLHYVYAGNLSGRGSDLESTFCPQCNQRLIRRRGFTVLENRLTPDGACPSCGTKIPGIWN